VQSQPPREGSTPSPTAKKKPGISGLFLYPIIRLPTSFFSYVRMPNYKKEKLPKRFYTFQLSCNKIPFLENKPR
jgi:hypothetical protein